MSSPVRTSRVRRRSASRGLFAIELDDGGSFRAAATTAEVDATLRQRELFGVGGIAEKLLAAHRSGLAGVILPRGNQREVDEDLGDELRRAVEVHYMTRVDELLELALEPSSSSTVPSGRVS